MAAGGGAGIVHQHHRGWRQCQPDDAGAGLKRGDGLLAAGAADDVMPVPELKHRDREEWIAFCKR
jgi:hypothetical protein